MLRMASVDIGFHWVMAFLTLTLLSEKIGTSRYAFMDYENDKTEPGLEVLKSIADTLGIDPTVLFDEYYSFLDYPYSTLVKEVRHKMGLTQKQFGTYFGVGRRSVERWEAGRNKVTRDVFEQMKKLEMLK